MYLYGMTNRTKWIGFFILNLVGFGVENTHAQILSGHFPAYANEEIALMGFSWLNTCTIAKTKSDAKGHFTIACQPSDRSTGYLMDADKKAYFVVLSGEDIALIGGIFPDPNRVECTAGKEQQAFIQYAVEQPRREQAISAWSYLENIYGLDTLFVTHSDARKAITHELERIESDDKAFLASLDPQSYVSWFLLVRKLVRSVSTIAQYRTN